MLSRPKAGVPAGTRGRLGGIPFKEDLNAPCPRSGGAAGGAARDRKNDPGKKNVPPWRRCPEERGPLAATTACSAAGMLHAATGSERGRVMPEKFRNGLARSGATVFHDSAGRDDSRRRGRATRSARLAELKSAVTSPDGRPIPVALGPQASLGLRGVA